MRVLRDLTNQGIAVALRHPILGLDFLLGVDAREKPPFERTLIQPRRLRELRIQRLRIHTCPVDLASSGYSDTQNVQNQHFLCHKGNPSGTPLHWPKLPLTP